MPAPLRPDKPWRPLEAAEVARLGGHLGVYQIADAEGRVVRIGAAGGRSLFGLRGELEKELAAGPAGRRVRVEVTTQYWSRRQELLMLHLADHGRLPEGNPEVDAARLGRLSPTGGGGHGP